MSFGISAAAWTAIAVGASAATQLYTADKQRSAQNKAMDQARRNAEASANQADQDFNKANRKQPDTMSLLSANQQSARGGVSGTMLTGSTGVDPGSLLLGKNTLLGL